MCLILRVSGRKTTAMTGITIVPMFRAKQHAASRSRRMAVPYGFDGNEGRVSKGLLSDANHLTPNYPHLRLRPIFFPRRSNDSFSIRKDNARCYHSIPPSPHHRLPEQTQSPVRGYELETGTMVDDQQRKPRQKLV